MGSMQNRSKPELLAPAGDFEKLESALHFGADAVYIGGERFGLRKASGNFDAEAMKKAVELTHRQGARLHVTLNIIPHNEDLIGLDDYIRFLDAIGVDAVIVADPGIFMAVKRNSDLELHISTQASVTNAETVKFWHEMGAKRVVLARELSLEEIRSIRKKTDPDLELEVFAHGAMCISYSGRCLLSNYMTGRDANQGDCAQACRWKYRLVEETRPGEYFPIDEDEHGTFLMNSKDLCLLPHLEKLVDAGVSSLKIEGRVKTQYYVSTVIHAYREAIDAMMEGRLTPEKSEELIRELEKTSHRAFTTGFLFGNPGAEGQNYESTSYIQNYNFLGIVKEYDAVHGLAVIEERNRFAVGDVIEILQNRPGYLEFSVNAIYDEMGNPCSEANVPRKIFRIPVPSPVEPGDLLRKIKV